MKQLLLLSSLLALSISGVAHASSSSDTALVKSLHQTERLVNSLMMDKPAQARVFAADGTEYTCAEALWLKARVRAAKLALAKDNSRDASRELQLVVETLKSHGSSISA